MTLANTDARNRSRDPEMEKHEREEKERKLAMRVWGLEGHLERSKGDIAFSR